MPVAQSLVPRRPGRSALARLGNACFFGGFLASLPALLCSEQAAAETASALGPEMSEGDLPRPGASAADGDESGESAGIPSDSERPAPSKAGLHGVAPDAAQRANAAYEPARVRIGLRLTPFAKVTTVGLNGTPSSKFVTVEPLRHTLRARLNQTNHFYVDTWHVETVPQRFNRQTRQYEVRLGFYRRYGAFGQLEEKVGSVDLAGNLSENTGSVYVLVGVARARLRDQLGQPVLDVVAGFAPAATVTQETPKPAATAARPPENVPPKPGHAAPAPSSQATGSNSTTDALNAAEAAEAAEAARGRF